MNHLLEIRAICKALLLWLSGANAVHVINRKIRKKLIYKILRILRQVCHPFFFREELLLLGEVGNVLMQHVNHIVGCCKIPVGVQIVQQEPELDGWHTVADDNVFTVFILLA